jgi:sugar/nucleoside kinase (ribokinase family)
MSFSVVGLGNALMDALVLLDDDLLLEKEALNKGIMHPVDHARWMEVYKQFSPEKISLQTGGSCANTIAKLGLMGAKVSYCGHVGNDEFGTIYTEQLQDACGHSALSFGTGATGKCLSLISPDAERTMLTDLGASVELPDIKHFIPQIQAADIFYSTGYLLLGDPMKSRLDEAIQAARSAKVPFAFDVADPFVVHATKKDMTQLIQDYADIIFLNEEEAKAMTGKESATDAINELKDICKTVVLKLGSKGSVVFSNGERITAGVHRVNAIDTTGAGDSFAAGFLYGWIHGWNLERSMRLASRIAAETVSQLGAVVRDRSRLEKAIAEIV